MAPRHASSLLPFIYLVLLFARALPTYGVCYRSDGILDMVPRPCPGSNMCCYLDRTDGYADDVCIQGACYSDYWKGQYFVVACTHQNWDEEGSGCSPLWDACGRQPDYTHVSHCADGSFCCGKGNTTCCSDHSGVYVNEDGTIILRSDSGKIKDTPSSSYTPHGTPIPTSLQTRSSHPAITSTPSEPSQTATAAIAPSSEDPKGGLSTDAKVGIGVGVPAVVLAAFGVWMQCRNWLPYRKRWSHR